MEASRLAEANNSLHRHTTCMRSALASRWGRDGAHTVGEADVTVLSAGSKVAFFRGAWSRSSGPSLSAQATRVLRGANPRAETRCSHVEASGLGRLYGWPRRAQVRLAQGLDKMRHASPGCGRRRASGGSNDMRYMAMWHTCMMRRDLLVPAVKPQPSPFGNGCTAKRGDRSAPRTRQRASPLRSSSSRGRGASRSCGTCSWACTCACRPVRRAAWAGVPRRRRGSRRYGC